ncbi:ArnT family glycosyltransferase [Desulfatibacillum aliphaticivorans]|uniref:ArnT family glycosyltransferase n=1 Tax=Desulfatibacillum aliphaticivorans TaxID=218208 RepID=UPI00040DC871|nr:glycosyltransferase family 39 protein [Desulfatibacillum aliphaticivorans]
MKATLNKNACSSDAPFVSDPAKPSVRIPALIYWTALALTIGALLYLSFNVLMNGTWDNYRYLNLGRAVYQQGELVQLDVPGHPPESFVPPGYPVIIGAIMKAAGHSRPILFIKGFNALCYWASLLIAAWIFRRFFQLGRTPTFLSVLYLSVNVSTIAFASVIFTHSPYILFSTLTLLMLFYYQESPKVGWIAAAGLCTASALYVRFPGLPLAAAAFLWMLLNKRFKHACLYAGLTAALLGFWAVPLLVSGDLEYLKQLTAKGCDFPAPQFDSLLSRYSHHLYGYCFDHIPQRALPGLFSLPHSEANGVPAALSSLLSAGAVQAMFKFGVPGLFLFEALARIRAKDWSLALLFPVVYLLMISLAASYWGRYVNYILPWFVLICVLGFMRFVKALELSPKAEMAAALAAIVLVFGSVSPQYVQRVQEASLHRGQLASLAKESKPCLEYGWTDAIPFSALPAHTYLVSHTQHGARSCPVIGAFVWSRENLPENALLMGCQTALGCFHAERPVVLLPYWWCKLPYDDPRAVLPESNEWTAREILRQGADFLVMNLNDPDEPCNQYMVQVVNAFPQSFVPVYIFGTPPAAAVVLRVRKALLQEALLQRGVENLP